MKQVISTKRKSIISNKKILACLLSVISVTFLVFQINMSTVMAETTTTINEDTEVSTDASYDILTIASGKKLTISGTTCVTIKNSLVINSGASIVVSGNATLKIDNGATVDGLKLYSESLALLTDDYDHAVNGSGDTLTFDWHPTEKKWVIRVVYQIDYDECKDNGVSQASINVGGLEIQKNVDKPFYINTPIIFTLCPPAKRYGSTPIVEVEVFDGNNITENTVFRSDFDGENKVNITNNNDNTYSFTYTPGSNEFKVRVWWSEYDALTQGDNQYMIETNNLNPTAGTVSFDDDEIAKDGNNSLFSTYGSNYEKAVFNSKIGNTITFTPVNGQYVQSITIGTTTYVPVQADAVNGKIYYANNSYISLNEGIFTYTTSNNDFVNDNYLYIEAQFTEVPQEAVSTFKVDYDAYVDSNSASHAFVNDVNDITIVPNASQSFSTFAQISLALCPPSDRIGKTPIAEIEIYNGDTSTNNTVYRSDDNSNKVFINSNNNNTYTLTYTPEEDHDFIIRVWWSKYDTYDFSAAKNAIENAGMAYYATNAATMKDYLAAHLWDAFFDDGVTAAFSEINASGHQATYSGIFNNLDSITQSLTISETTSKTDSVIPKISGNSGNLPYYTYSIKLYDHSVDNSKDIVANGKIYVLENSNSVVAKFTNGNTVTYVTKDCSASETIVYNGSYSMNGDKPQVEFFGNAAEPVNTWNSGTPEYLFAGHMTTEHFKATNKLLNSGINAQIIVINTDCNAIKVTGNGEYGTAAAWGWSNLSWYATNGTTASNPKEFDVYIGDTVISISKADTVASKNITSIVCSLENASKAVEITGTNDVYNIKPRSNFYNSLPLTITYTDGTKAYIKINRVALAIDASIKTAGSNNVTIFHGTDNSGAYPVDGAYTIYGSFYYPTNKTAEENGRVSLEVTYTWANGSTTRETISPVNGNVITDANQGTTHVDDFILWNGDKDDRPVKVQATAIVSGSTDTKFKGALIGSGAGVTWVAK